MDRVVSGSAARLAVVDPSTAPYHDPRVRVVRADDGAVVWSGTMPMSLLKSGVGPLTENGFVAEQPDGTTSVVLAGITLNGDSRWRYSVAPGSDLILIDRGVIEVANSTAGAPRSTLTLLG
jgi:hypothetical protein